MRLPVIETCDMCSEYVVRAADGSGRCVHLRLGGDVLGASPPPSWCPLRTGPDADRLAALERVAEAVQSLRGTRWLSARLGRADDSCAECAPPRRLREALAELDRTKP